MASLYHQQAISLMEKRLVATNKVSLSDLLRLSTVNAVASLPGLSLWCNKYICEIADRILFVGVNKNSSLYPLKEKYQDISLEHTETL